MHGIDVSKYQGDIDWHTVRASGIDFAFIKATEGGDHTDDRFLDNWQAARAAGVPRGAYHYYYFCRPAAEQAAWFINHVPREPGALPPVLDLEWTHKSKTCRYFPDPATVRREALLFLQALTAYYGKRPIIYTTVDFYHDNELGAAAGLPLLAALGGRRTRRTSTPTSAGPSGSIPAPASWRASTAPPTSTSSAEPARSGRPGRTAAEAADSPALSA